MTINLTPSRFGLFTPRVLLAFTLCSVGVLLAMLSFAAGPAASTNDASRSIRTISAASPSEAAAVRPCISLGTRVTVSVLPPNGSNASGCLPLANAGVPRSMANQASSASATGGLGTIATVAGSVGNGYGPSLGQGVPWNVAYASGSLYISDQLYNVVRRLDLSTGQQTVIAGNGGLGFNGDGPATSVEMDGPWGIAVDSGGNIYIADSGRIRRVDTSGQMVTVANQGATGLAFDKQGSLIIADYVGERVLKLDVTTGIITLVAGTGSFGYNGDNQPATSAQLALPNGVAVDSVGNIYIAELSGARIRKVDGTGTITTFAGTGTAGFSGDGGPAGAAQISNPAQLSFDTAGNLYFDDTNNGRVRKVDTSGIITSVAGGGSTIPTDGVLALSARFNTPYYGASVAPDGTLFIADTNGSKVWRVNASGAIVTVAGNGTWGESGDGGLAAQAQISQADNVAFDATGNEYIADWVFSVVRKVSPEGTITTVAGLLGGNQYSPNGYRGYNGDQIPATQAMLHSPAGMAVDTAGNLYIADSFNNRVRKVDTSGIIHTVAGNGTAGYSGDTGPATQAELDQPNGVAVDNKGNIYIADTGTSNLPVGGNRIRKVAPDGTITTVAGTGIGGYNSDGIPAIAAEVNGPNGLAVDSAGNLYVADTFNSRIRKIDMSGVTPIISTVAGNGTFGFSGDGGPAILAKLEYPTGVSVDGKGNIAIADNAVQRVRMVDTSGNINTIAGNGTRGLSGDGAPAIQAMLAHPGGVAFDAVGNAFIADGTYPLGNNRVRKVTLVPPVQLTSVVSRKVHGTAGTFDIDLPLTGTRGVECRGSGSTNDYTLVFTFLNPVTNCGTTSTGSVSSGPNPNQCTVNLTGVANAQYITVTLTGAVDSTGATGNVSGTMGVLVGDVNATGLVDGNDVSAVQGQARQSANSTNFRLDVNATGLIDGNDVSLVQSKTRTSLPSPP